MKNFLAICLCLGFLPVAKPAYGADMEKIAEDYNELGFQLLAQCRQTLAETNYFLSPASLAFALSMVQNGARGETLRQILSTLHVTNIPAAQLDEENKALMDHLSKLDANIKLEIANAIWVDKGEPVKPDFIAMNQRDYGAGIFNADFSDPSTLADINNWVSDRTHDKIKSIINRLDPNLRLILLNAIYFKADWARPFDTNLTQPKAFTLGNGQVIQHPRMSRTANYNYCLREKFQLLELPYVGQQISMFVLLPNVGLKEFLQEFTMADFQDAIVRLYSEKVTLEMPRFKLENEYDLTKVLRLMGMPLAFSLAADFSGMSDQQLNIGFVKQKTYVDVNEQGTEAAAVTVVGVGRGARMEEPVPFIVDRPFLIVIRENQSGLILFLGAIFDPR
jgi:serpin B